MKPRLSFMEIWAFIVLGISGLVVLSLAWLSLVAGDYEMAITLIVAPGSLLAATFIFPVIIYRKASKLPVQRKSEVEVVNHYFFEDGTVLTERVHKSG